MWPPLCSSNQAHQVGRRALGLLRAGGRGRRLMPPTGWYYPILRLGNTRPPAGDSARVAYLSAKGMGKEVRSVRSAALWFTHWPGRTELWGIPSGLQRFAVQ